PPLVVPVPDPDPDPVPAPAPVAAPIVPDCERLDVYRVAVEFQVLAARVVQGRRLGALRDQLDRASVSIVLNIAEGSGRFAPAEKAHFYLIARGSAMECLAAWSLLQDRSQLTAEDHRRGRASVIRVLAMLTRLAATMHRKAGRSGAGASGRG